MATLELEYLRYTFKNNIFNREDRTCDEKACCCLDGLQLSLLSLVLKDPDYYSDGKLYEFYDIFHIYTSNNKIIDIEKCSSPKLALYLGKQIFFDTSNNKYNKSVFEESMTLEKKSIDFLATAMYCLNCQNHVDNESYRDCNKSLIDMSLLNTRLLMLVSFNMFYGLLSKLEREPKYKHFQYIEQYIKMIERMNHSVESKEIRRVRSEIIQSYQKKFEKQLYNRREIAERIAEYFYGLTFERDQIEEISVLGNLDYLCAVLEKFCEICKLNNSQKEIFATYILNLKKIMNINIGQNSKYKKAQYKMNEINQLNEIKQFVNAIVVYCKENNLFIVGHKSVEIKTERHDIKTEEKHFVERLKNIVNIFKKR